MKAQRGFVLVVVLWVLAILTVVTIGFGHRSFLERRAAAYSLDQAQALAAARGTAHRGVLELQNKWILDRLRQPPMGQGQAAPSTHRGQAWAQPVNLYDAEGPLAMGQEFGEDTAWFRITDFESRINVNTADEELLRQVPGMNDAVLSTLLFRRAPGNGAPPAPLQSIEELRAIEGVSEELWFGSSEQPGFRDTLTTHGQGRININTAPRAVLACVPGLGGGGVEAILAWRAGPDGELDTADDQGFHSFDDLREKTGIQGNPLQALQRFGTFNSQVFQVEGIATRRAGTVRTAVTAVVQVNMSNATYLEWREKSLGA